MLSQARNARLDERERLLGTMTKEMDATSKRLDKMKGELHDHRCQQALYEAEQHRCNTQMT